MSEMLESFVKKTMSKQIREKYPHMQYPSGMYARVVSASNNTYTLKILDKNLSDSNDFPEIPNVRSEIELEKGDIAVVLLLYGGNGFHILGRRDS